MNDDEIRQFLREGTRAPRRRVDLAEVHRRGLRRRASVVGGGATLALALAAAVIISLPPSGDVVVFSQPPSLPIVGPEEPALPTPEVDDALLPEHEEPEPEPEPAPTTEPRAETVYAEPQPEPQPTEAPQPPPEDDADYGPVFWERRFSAVTVTENGQPRPQPEIPISISFDRHPDHEPHQQEMMRWEAGCKPTFTPVTITAERMHLDFENSIHAMGGPPCDGEYREQSQWIEEFLRTHPFWRLEGDRLRLWFGDTVIEFEEKVRDIRPAIPESDGPSSPG